MRGSVIALAGSGANPTAINRYDEYGNPQGGGITGRFGYTGQAWLPEIALQYSKARMYSPALGRFLQTDPIGVAGGINLYAYVLNDPINLVDPLGSKAEDPWAVLPYNPNEAINCIGWSWCGSLPFTGNLPSVGAMLLSGVINGAGPVPPGNERGRNGSGDPQIAERRDCNIIQREMQKAGDAAADWANIGFDVAMGSWTGGIMASAVPRSPVYSKAGQILSGPVKTKAFAFSGIATVLSSGFYLLSGQGWRAAVKGAVDYGIGRSVKGAGPIGELFKDEVSGDAKSAIGGARCQ